MQEWIYKETRNMNYKIFRTFWFGLVFANGELRGFGASEGQSKVY